MTGANAFRAWMLLSRINPNDITVKIVRAAFCYDIDDTAGRTAELGHVRVGRDLIFLYRFLRNGRARGVDRVVGKVGSVDLNQRRTAALAADIQTRCRRRPDRAAVVAADGRDRQGKTGRTAFIDRQVLDASLVDRRRNRCFCRLDQLDRLAGDVDDQS